MTSAASVQLQSVLTCPHCKVSASETMPTDACWFFYDCRNCGKLLRPDAGSLLRILFVRQRAVPADAGKPALLLKRLARPTNQALGESNARSRRRNHKPMAAMTVKTAPA